MSLRSGARPCGNQERGQALVYGLFFLIAGLGALFFMFNVGQVVSEKTKLVNTADAVAYSAGVLHARALNFDAYTNRALIANEVLVAQMVSLSSWAKHQAMHVEGANAMFPACTTLEGAAAGILFFYDALYAPACFFAATGGDMIKKVGETASALTEVVLTGVEANKKAIQAAQSVLHAPGVFQATRASLMQEVADANYAGDGSVSVDPANALVVSAMNDDWRTFTHRYTGAERSRLKDVVVAAAHSDPFTRSRSWDSTALLPSCLFNHNVVRRRGGTDMVGLDEWKAEDTVSLHRKRWRRFRCRNTEMPFGYGEQEAHPDGLNQDDSGAYLGGSPATNRRAHAQATQNSSASWTGYSGLPNFYDLSPAWLKHADPDVAADPRLKFGVRVVREASQLKTSDARSQVGTSSGSRINNYPTTLGDNRMAAVSTVEVFFERPFSQSSNAYGARQSPPQPRELASLFNPYWQVRLVSAPADIASQQLRQGAGIPLSSARQP